MKSKWIDLIVWMNWFCMWTNHNEFRSNLFDLHFQDCERFKGLRRKTSRFRRSRIIGRYVSWRNIFLRAIYFLKWILISAYHLSFRWSIKVLEEEMPHDDSSDTKKEWARGPIKFRVTFSRHFSRHSTTLAKIQLFQHLKMQHRW